MSDIGQLSKRFKFDVACGLLTYTSWSESGLYSGVASVFCTTCETTAADGTGVHVCVQIPAIR